MSQKKVVFLVLVALFVSGILISIGYICYLRGVRKGQLQATVAETNMELAAYRSLTESGSETDLSEGLRLLKKTIAINYAKMKQAQEESYNIKGIENTIKAIEDEFMSSGLKVSASNGGY